MKSYPLRMRADGKKVTVQNGIVPTADPQLIHFERSVYICLKKLLYMLVDHKM